VFFATPFERTPAGLAAIVPGMTSAQVKLLQKAASPRA
jgi:hypothetical protein